MRLVPVGRGNKKHGKHLTIPQLELLAILIGTRVSNFVLEHLKIEVSSRKWLKSLSVFVENRTKEILRERDVTFQYVISSRSRH